MASPSIEIYLVRGKVVFFCSFFVALALWIVVVILDWSSVHAFGVVTVARVVLMVLLIGVRRGLLGSAAVHKALVGIRTTIATHTWLYRSRWHPRVHCHMRWHHMGLRVDVVRLDRARMMVLALAQMARVDRLRHVILLRGCRVHVVVVHRHGCLVEFVVRWHMRGGRQIVDWLRMLSMVAYRMWWLTVHNFVLGVASLPATKAHRRRCATILGDISVGFGLRAPALLLLIRMIIACTH